MINLKKGGFETRTQPPQDQKTNMRTYKRRLAAVGRIFYIGRKVKQDNWKNITRGLIINFLC